MNQEPQPQQEQEQQPQQAGAEPGEAPAAKRPVVRGEIVAGPGRYYRYARYVLTALFFGFGLWCIYDGFVSWPAKNAELVQQGKAREYTDMSININRALGVVLPVASLALLAWTFHNSRGRYRLTADDVLEVPGHPPVPLAAIRRVDKSLLDRKGILFLDYELDTGQAGRLKLDDFVYDQTPTDQIFDRIDDHIDRVTAEAQEAAEASAAAAEDAAGGNGNDGPAA